MIRSHWRAAGASVALLAWLGARASPGLEPERVSFLAADGLRIAADYFPPPAADRGPAPMVVLLHGCGGDRRDWEPLLVPLHAAGCGILVPDLRGHGESATTETRARVAALDPALFREMQADLRGAYDWLAARPRVDRARFALVAAGTGCGVALQYAAQDRSVDAVVCLSPGLREAGLDSAGDIRQLTGRRALLVAGEHERDAPYTLRQRAEHAAVRTYPVRASGTGLLEALPDLPRELAAFVKDAVGPPTDTTVYGSIESHIYHPPDSGWLARISPTNLRYYSSPAEAEARGLRRTRSKTPPGSAGGPSRDDAPDAAHGARRHGAHPPRRRWR